MHGNHHHHQRTDLGGIMSITSVFTIGSFVPCTPPPLQNPKYASDVNMLSQTKWGNVDWKTSTFFIQRLQTFFFIFVTFFTFFIFHGTFFYIYGLNDPAQASTLWWDQGYGAEGRARLYGATSALVDMPGVANPLKDGCSKYARLVVWWVGSRKMSEQTKSSLCDNWGDWGLTCSTPHFFVGDMRRIWNMYYTAKMVRLVDDHLLQAYIQL